MTTITESWNAIDTWLRGHAPTTAAMLAPGAEPEEIAAAETTLGLTFNPELVESLRQHNGVQDSTAVLPMGVPLSLDEIIEHRRC
jgi:cell wall assembly regulator SMI1